MKKGKFIIMKVKTFLLLTLLLSGVCCAINAQTVEEAKKAPKPTEKEFCKLSTCCTAGAYWVALPGHLLNDKKTDDTREYLSDAEVLAKLSNFYSWLREKYPKGVIRNFKYYVEEKDVAGQSPNSSSSSCSTYIIRSYYISGSYCMTDPDKVLLYAIDQALDNVREGNRLAIDQIRVTDGENKEDFKDKVVEHLLDEGYKVVAKEYLEKLYEELQAQQSGIYNDRTTVQENNFSAVGYYVNVKKTETAIKVQVINVSTGEYESNITVKTE